MTLLVLLNELSCRREPAQNSAAMPIALGNLVTMLRAVKRERSDLALVTEVPLPHLLTELAPEWQADGRTRERARFLRGLSNRAPFTSVTPPDLIDVTEYQYSGQRAKGLGGAHLVEGLAASLAVAPDWADSVITLHRLQMLEDDAGDLSVVEDDVAVRHASAADHVDVHRGWLVERGLRDVHTGPQLWQERADLFPALRFLPRVEADLEDLNPYWLVPVKELLARFQDAVRAWDGVAAIGPLWPGKVTPEHEARRARWRIFDPATGKDELFDQHVRFTPNPGRLHFRWDPAVGQVVVAYVGRKAGV